MESLKNLLFIRKINRLSDKPFPLPWREGIKGRGNIK
jgi:hypothetical protein